MNPLRAIALFLSGAIIATSLLMANLGFSRHALSRRSATILAAVGVGIGVGVFIFYGISDGDILGSVVVGVIASVTAGITVYITFLAK